jgi:hypothetical protein
METGVCEFELGMEVTLTSVLCNPGRRLAMFVSLLLLFLFHRFIPHNRDCSMPRIGMPLLRTLSQARTYPYFPVDTTSEHRHRKQQ